MIEPSASAASAQEPAPFRLTALAHGGGCGCKIGPALLRELLSDACFGFQHPDLLVGATSSAGGIAPPAPLRISLSTPGAILQPQPPPCEKEVSRRACASGAFIGLFAVIEAGNYPQGPAPSPVRVRG